MSTYFIIIFLFSTSIFAKETSFKISYDPNYAPFSYKQDDKAAGLLIDIWKLWAKYNNYSIEFVDNHFELINIHTHEKFYKKDPFIDAKTRINNFDISNAFALIKLEKYEKRKM